MRDISSQFYGELEIASWILNGLNKIPELINKNVPKKYPDNIPEPNFWIISPKDENTLYLYGQSPSSFTSKITSLNVKSESPEIIVQCSFSWYRLKRYKSASSIARVMDCLLHGLYTDLPLIHSDEIFNIIEDHIENEKS